MPGGRPSIYSEELAARICERPGLCAIYAISDCEGVVRYVGKAINPHKRWLQHKADRNRVGRPVYNWLRREMDAGRSVNFAVLEWVPRDAWEVAERRLIAEHRKSGKLLNLAPGGSGGTPERKPAYLSAEIKRIRNAKIAFSRFWNKLSEDARSKVREQVLKKAKVWAKQDPEIAQHLKDLGVWVPA